MRRVPAEGSQAHRNRGPGLRWLGRTVALGCALWATDALAGASARAQPCEELAFGLIEHTCFHARFGPFAERAASPGTTATRDTPNIDAVHTHFRITLPAGAPSVVTYAPPRSGLWSVFFEPDVPFELLAADDSPLEPSVVYAISTCPFLPQVRVYDLEQGTRYRLVFRPSDSSSVVIVNEKVDDFLVAVAPDSDGDGYGDSASAVPSACAPLPGYVDNDLDCDDADADRHPGAPERCDSIDENCNGVPDDVGLPCRSGLGACSVRGTSFCPAPDALAMCDATPAEPGLAEACDGIDEDCDGSIDEGADAVCGLDRDRPRCVSNGPGRFCGCERDPDCGGRQSGRVCLLMPTSQRCIDGCIDVAGRNGCPSGLVCTSRDPARPGECVAPTDGGGSSSDDAGALDAGASHDAGPRDAGARADAGPGLDADRGRGPDAGAASPGAPGCSCSVGSRAPRSLAAAIALLLAALLMRALRSRGARAPRVPWDPRRARAWGSARALAVLLCGPALGGCARSRELDPPAARDTGAAEDAAAAPDGAWVLDDVGHGVDAAAREDGGAESDAGCVAILGARPLRHSCQHAERGPVTEVDAAPSAATSPPDVSQSHRAYRIFVPGTGSIREGWVAYRPSRQGLHALMVSADATPSVTDGRGAGVPSSHEQPTAECSELPRAFVVDLTAGEDYVIRLQIAGASSTMFFAEHLPTFGEDAWARRCD